MKKESVFHGTLGIIGTGLKTILVTLGLLASVGSSTLYHMLFGK
jgi:hypothetical protein